MNKSLSSKFNRFFGIICKKFRLVGLISY